MVKMLVSMKTKDLRLKLTMPDLRSILRNTKAALKSGRVIPVKRFDDQSQKQLLAKNRFEESSRIPSLMPPIGAGHEDDDNVLGRSDLPKQGEVINLWIEGNILFADFGRVPKQVIKLVKAGVYDKVSCELWEKPPGKFAGEGWMLKRVALLGADVPGVYTLEEIPDPDEGMGMIRRVEIFEVGTHNNIKYTLDDLKTIVRNYWLNRPSDQKIKQTLRRYLKLDAVKPLGDGAAAGKFKDEAVTVRVFRSLSKSYSVDNSSGSKSMTADQIRQALVSEGIFEQDEVNSMSDAVVMKLAKLCGLEAQNEDDKPTEKPKEAANEDETSTDETETAANEDTKPAATPPPKPSANADAAKTQNYIDRMVTYRVAKGVAAALEPLEAKLRKLEGSTVKLQKTSETHRQSQIKDQAKMFCDRMRSERKLTHGMMSGAVELYQLLADVPGEVHFTDGAGKSQKASPVERFKSFLETLPTIENWDEKHGGPLGPVGSKDRKSANEQKLKDVYQKFNSSFKKQMSEEKYLKTFESAQEMYGEDYSVEQFCASM